MLSLVISGGAILGTAMSILINKKMNITSLKFKSIAKVWLSCVAVCMLATTIALMVMGGIFMIIWAIIKVAAVGLFMYGLYYTWRKLFKKI